MKKHVAVCRELWTEADLAHQSIQDMVNDVCITALPVQSSIVVWIAAIEDSGEQKGKDASPMAGLC